jgi:hypothetical protein
MGNKIKTTATIETLDLNVISPFIELPSKSLHRSGTRPPVGRDVLVSVEAAILLSGARLPIASCIEVACGDPKGARCRSESLISPGRHLRRPAFDLSGVLPDYFRQLAAAQFLTFFANPLPSLAQVLSGHLPAVAA